MGNKPKRFTIYPSDFGFLFNECKACYYKKYVMNKRRPALNMPSIFSTIDSLMTSYYDNKSTQLISKELDPGIITLGGLSVKSKPIPCPDYDCEFIIEGKVDSLLKFDNGTFGITDFKTTEPKQKSQDLYFYQLMAYAVALEHNDPEKTRPCKISRMGLCCYSPRDFDAFNDRVALIGDITWVEIEKDADKFKKRLKKIAKILTGELPESNPNCSYCNFRNCD